METVAEYDARIERLRRDLMVALFGAKLASLERTLNDSDPELHARWQAVYNDMIHSDDQIQAIQKQINEAHELRQIVAGRVPRPGIS